MKKLIKFIGIGLSSLALILFHVSAVSAEGDVVITGEAAPTMTPVTFGDFAAVALDGTTQTTTLNIPQFTVTDATGSGSGWNVTLTGTQFSNADPTPKSLSTGSLTLTTAPNVSLDDPNSSPADTITVATTGPTATIDTGTGLKLLSAAVDGGMGSYFVGDTTPGVMTLELMPREVYATTYTSTLTLTIATGP
ncbi:WxL domain-containing protein [Halobacillus yeomjeoni]|uniref:WxL domain-containing protein n=1 Tax=Halobacillus yeomjeoni TaxID=311194 RepID=A0A931HXN4_9BACI|nr:WxL domain-containing protein [Halobacillus yeomjeoni]MBH0231334.1 WxL domain-containing protein [Halobacillus yeomjeoni]